MPFRFQSVHCSSPAGVIARLYGFDKVVVVVVVVVVEIDLVVVSFRSNNELLLFLTTGKSCVTCKMFFIICHLPGVLTKLTTSSINIVPSVKILSTLTRLTLYGSI